VIRTYTLALAAALWTGACAEYIGPTPAPGELVQPIGITVHPSGRYVYVVNSNFNARYEVSAGGNIVVIDADTLEPTTDEPYRFGSYGARVILWGPDPLAPTTLGVAVRGDSGISLLQLTPDGGRVFCASTGVEDACSFQLGRDIYDLTPLPRPSLVPENFEYWMAAGLDGRVYLLSIPDGNLQRAAVLVRGALSGNNVLRVFEPTSEVFIAGRFSNRIAALSYFGQTDGEPGGIIINSQSQYPTTLGRAEIRDLRFSSDGTRAWVSAGSPSSLMTLDVRQRDEGLATNQILRRVDLDGGPAEMVVVTEDGRDTLYIALADDEAIAVVDGETSELLDLIPLDALAFGLAVDTVRHQRLYVTLFDEDAVAVIDINPASPSFRSVIAEVRQ